MAINGLVKQFSHINKINFEQLLLAKIPVHNNTSSNYYCYRNYPCKMWYKNM